VWLKRVTLRFPAVAQEPLDQQERLDRFEGGDENQGATMFGAAMIE